MKLSYLKFLALATHLLSTPVYAAQYEYHPNVRLALRDGFNSKNITAAFSDCLKSSEGEWVHECGAAQLSVFMKVVSLLINTIIKIKKMVI